MLAASLSDLWKFTKGGNTAVEFFSELASDDPYRRGIGLSRMSQCLCAAGELLESEFLAKVVKVEILDKAKAGWEELKPHATALNSGRAATTAGRLSLGSLASMSQSTVNVGDAEMSEAASAVYAWLMKPQAPFRGLLSLLSLGGSFFVGSVNEKMARAALSPDGGKLTLRDFTEAAVARTQSGGAHVQRAPAGGSEGLSRLMGALQD